MSYLVLARKWRPKRFAELVGQEHVVRALSNALDSGRVHHAFLFTGTRGVGKTTIARIFAKSLNCERGIGAEPCGACAVCEAVDAGRFVDLLEIDAASNTGVDDVREVIENAQYMPTRGRYKVYLIDEVHMLSKNAFNALLKTLEEPPEHVKFLLATTDPQKLPVTVLSRCLQFNLRRLTLDQIAAQMGAILAAEGVESDAGSIELLARGADGSLRDGLSLLDQALAFCGGALAEAEVRAMLGSVDRSQVDALLHALAAGDGRALMDCAEAIAGFAPDFGSVLEDLAHALHRIQLRQLVPDIEVGDERIDIAAHAASIAPDMVQLWYQMALNGRRDLALAPSPRVGFDMTLLRMLAFRPVGEGDATPTPAPSRSSGAERAAAAAPRATAPVPRVATTASPEAHAPAATAPPASSPPPLPIRPAHGDDAPARPVSAAAPDAEPRAAGDSPALAPAVTAPHALAHSDDWLDLLHQLALRGPLRELAANAAFVGLSGEVLRLALPDTLEHFRSEKLILQLASAVGEAIGRPLRIEFVAPRDDAAETLHDRSRRERSQRQGEAEVAFHADPAVQRLVEQYGARVQPDSIRPVDDR